MLASAVLVGRPGDLVPLGGRVDAYATRIGGTPVLPPGCGAMPDSTCARCGAPLALLLQVGRRPVQSTLPRLCSQLLYRNAAAPRAADARSAARGPGPLPLPPGLRRRQVPGQLAGAALPAGGS